MIEYDAVNFHYGKADSKDWLKTLVLSIKAVREKSDFSRRSLCREIDHSEFIDAFFIDIWIRVKFELTGKTSKVLKQDSLVLKSLVTQKTHPCYTEKGFERTLLFTADQTPLKKEMITRAKKLPKRMSLYKPYRSIWQCVFTMPR